MASFHRILSSKLVAILFPYWEMRNLSIISIFQSLNDLENRGFQPPSSTEESQTYATDASFEATNAYKERKETLKALSPHYLSSQNLTLLLFPAEKMILLFIKHHSFLIFFQNPTPYPSLTSQVRTPFLLPQTSY